MLIAVALSHGDDGIFRHYLPEEGIAGAGVAAVVANFKHVRLQLGSGVQHSLLRLPLGVPGKEEGGLPVAYHQDNGTVVGILPGVQAQYLHLCAAQGILVPHLRHRKAAALFLGVLLKGLKNSAVVLRHRAEAQLRFPIAEGPRQSADVVLMGMSAHNYVQLFRPGLFQHRVYNIGIAPVAAVYEHIMSVALHQGGIRLAHVYEVYREAAPLRQVFRLRCQGRLSRRSRRRRGGCCRGSPAAGNKQQSQAQGYEAELYFSFSHAVFPPFPIKFRGPCRTPDDFLCSIVAQPGGNFQTL